MQTHDVGRAFWCSLKVRRGTPLLHFAPMRQGCWPYLQGKMAVLSLGQKALALGWWTPADPLADEEEMMLKAIQGHAEGRLWDAPLL